MPYDSFTISDRSCVKFSQAAFENPFQYLDRDETSVDISKYKDFLTKTSVTNPGFHVNIIFCQYIILKNKNHFIESLRLKYRMAYC